MIFVACYSYKGGASGIVGLFTQDLALGALPTVPLYEANRGGSAARGGVDVARGARPTAVLLRPRAGLSGCGLYNAPRPRFTPLSGAVFTLPP